jgi:hypothetical protein
VNNPSGILVQGVDGFAITGVRVANVASGVVTFVSGGSISGSYLGPAGTSVGLFGGDSETTVVVLNNTIEYRANGVAVAGGIQANPTTGTPAGTAITAHIWRNTIVTSYTDVGPTNPAAVRLAPMIQEATDGDTRATVLYNRVLGPTKYSFLIFAGPQVALGGGPYTGTVEAAIFGTELDEAAAEALAVVTFTNARATIWPDPRYRPADYMQDGLFDLRHGGELDTALVDHPQFFGGVELGNVYLENGEVVDYGTFVVVP